MTDGPPLLAGSLLGRALTEVSVSDTLLRARGPSSRTVDARRRVLRLTFGGDRLGEVDRPQYLRLIDSLAPAHSRRQGIRQVALLIDRDVLRSLSDRLPGLEDLSRVHLLTLVRIVEVALIRRVQSRASEDAGAHWWELLNLDVGQLDIPLHA